MAAAPDKTVALKTAKVAETLSIEGSAPQHTTTTGAVDFASGRASLDLTVESAAATVVTDSGTVYERIPAAAALGGKPWLKMDLTQVGSALGVTELASLVAVTTDPATTLEAVRGAGTITKVGSESVRATKTTHYRAVANVAAAATTTPPAQQARLRQMTSLLGLTTLPVDVWVDGQGQVRRIAETLDYSKAHLTDAAPTALPTKATVTIDYYGFGTAAAVQVPTPDQVVDISSITSGAALSDGAVPASPATTALEAQLINLVPVGYVRRADSVGDTGPSDLAKAARDDGASDARQVLTKDGFVAGYQRLWEKGQSQLVVFIYKFGTPAGASDYGARSLEGVDQAPPGGTVTPFDLSAIPGAKGFVEHDKTGSGAIVAFTRGGYSVQILLNGTEATPTLATQLGLEQYNKLA